MKALILAAGFGTRLAPYTQAIPKALFPVDGIPVLERMITGLKQAGCTAIAVNAHHLAHQIKNYLADNTFELEILFSHENEILGTGGAIRKLSDFWDDEPFIVVNADIVTDIQLESVYLEHLKCGAQVSLVMHDHLLFNNVWVDSRNRIVGFKRFCDTSSPVKHRKLAFTGIHVMDKRILSWIPEKGFGDIISVYQKMIHKGITILATPVSNHYWQDMGTPEQFRDAVMDIMAPGVFLEAFPETDDLCIQRKKLAGDGSDRKWFRLATEHSRLVVSDHGITLELPGSELNAFIQIGRHLYERGIRVPRVYAYDTFSGLVFMEDLGDCHLQQWAINSQNADQLETVYRSIIDTLFDLTIKAIDGFDPCWTYQSPIYDQTLILEKECRYFMEAFVNAYLNLSIPYDDVAEEFSHLAHCTIDQGIDGLIHRDFQSRNIMIYDNNAYLIDFQGARFGPIQYDLASLLIDPYVSLDSLLQQRLLNYATEEAVRRFSSDPDRFVQGFNYCCITRNLQMLGAFGFLTRVKQKKFFEQWIPAAGTMLLGHIDRADSHAFPKLAAIAKKITLR